MILEIGLIAGAVLLLGGNAPAPLVSVPTVAPPPPPANPRVAGVMAKRVVAIGIPPQLAGTARQPLVIPRITATGVYPQVARTPMMGQGPAKPVLPRGSMISPPFMGRR